MRGVYRPIRAIQSSKAQGQKQPIIPTRGRFVIDGAGPFLSRAPVYPFLLVPGVLLAQDKYDRWRECGGYPWQPYRQEYIAERLGVSVEDLGFRFFTVRAQYGPALNRMAFQDMLTRAKTRPAEFVLRLAIQASWVWTSDLSAWEMVVHAILLLPLVMALAVQARRRPEGWELFLPPLPCVAIHALSMAFIAHATYSLPLLPPVLVAAAISVSCSVASPQDTTPARGRDSRSDRDSPGLTLATVCPSSAPDPYP